MTFALSIIFKPFLLMAALLVIRPLTKIIYSNMPDCFARRILFTRWD